MTDYNKSLDIEELRTEAKRLLELKKTIKEDETERKRIFNEYAKIMMKIKYYTDEEFKENKKKLNKEHHEQLKNNEYYKNMKNKISSDYYYNVKRNKPLKHLGALCVF